MVIKKKVIISKKKAKEECNNCCKWHHGHTGGAIYGLGVIGAAIYFIGHAATFWIGVLGFLKALVWPVFVIYHLLAFLGL